MFVVFLIIGLLALVGGAELLVRGGGALALRLRVPALAVGLTVVAFGTSTPELAVNVLAAMSASTEVALANVNGSNFANILLVLGVGALVRPLRVERSLVRREIPAALILAGLVPLFLLTDARITRLEGALLFLVGVIYNILLLRAAWRGRVQVDDDLEPTGEGHWALQLVKVLLGILILLGGAQLFVSGAMDLAELIGFSDRFIGLTVVALGTSAPEIATSVVSSLRGSADLAVGNSLGSNILNIAMVLGITAMIYPVEMIDAKAWYDMGAVVVVTLILLPIALRARLGRVGGALMILAYGVYMGLSPS